MDGDTMQPTNIPDFERSSMWSDVEDVIHSTSPQPIYDYKALVHTVKEDIEVWDLFSIETVRDYATKIADSPKILFKIGLGDYVNRLFPYRENLEVTIRKIPLKGNGEERSEKRPVVVTRSEDTISGQSSGAVARILLVLNRVCADGADRFLLQKAGRCTLLHAK
jgi:hypothetical protein